MTKFHPGQDIIVDFGGIEHAGEVVSHRGGYVMAQITLADNEADYGGITPSLDPQPIVCVRETNARPAVTE